MSGGRCQVRDELCPPVRELGDALGEFSDIEAGYVLFVEVVFLLEERQPRQLRLTDVHGRVVERLLA
jgi:hypothetical protein